MKTLLRIDASARTEGSHSRDIADYYQSKWAQRYPEGRVKNRDLSLEPVPHLTEAMIQAFYESKGKASPATALSDNLIAELKEADHVLFSSPLYNLCFPSTLKSYIDHVVRSDMTFTAKDGQYTGLLADKSATIITTMGGIAPEGTPEDFQSAYLKTILAFMGMGPVETVMQTGTSLTENERTPHMEKAKQEINALFQKAPEPQWTGRLSTRDKQELTSLRDQQASAIMNGDAKAYTNICTEDIQLMIPGHDIIAGREQFQKAEENLFKSASFVNFKKYPERIDRSGDMVVETGRQEIGMAKATEAGGVYSAFQKYTHIYRLTGSGWRYAVLMSNHSK